MKKMLTLMLAAAMLLSFAACSSNTPGGSDAVPEDKTEETTPAEEVAANAATETYKCVTMINDGTNQSNADMCLRIKEVFEAAGGECTNLYTDANPATEREYIENAIAANVDVIVTQPNTGTTNEDLIMEAIEAGIIVICFDAPYENAEYSYCHLAGNDALGRIIGGCAADWAEEQEITTPVVGLICLDTNVEIIKRTEGEIAAIKEKFPEAQFVMRTDAINAADGAAAAENFLTAYPEMNILCAVNDGGALGFYESIKAMNLDHEFGIFSTDAMTEAVEDIAAETEYIMTVDLDLNQVGEDIANEALAILKGENTDGKGSRTNVEFPMEVIDRTNAKAWLDAQ